MKRKFILYCLLTCCILPLWGQTGTENELRERVYLQTDKQVYLAGELVWIKMLTAEPDGYPLAFSKTGYIELLDGATARAQVKLALRNGTGSGTLVLPANLASGTYRLVGYTRYMRNESPDVFFEKIIGVVNPLESEVPVPPSASAETFPSASPFSTSGSLSGTISVGTDRESYAPRSRVELRIGGLPSDLHTLSVSVTGRDAASAFPVPGIARWKEGLATLPQVPVADNFTAEYEGHIIHGRLLEANSDKPAYSTRITPVVAFPGNEIALFTGEADPEGSVSFHTQRADGYTEMVSTILGEEGSAYRLVIDPPFHPAHKSRPVPRLDLNRIDRERLARLSVGLQSQYAYLSDSLMRFDYPAPHFFSRPDRRFLMEEYRKFGTMEEVITEFVTFVRFRNVGKKLYLSILHELVGFNNPYTLVLLDGIPIIDHRIIHEYNPLLLSRIDVYYSRFVLEGLRCDGIVAMYTEKNNYPELSPDPFTRIVPYESPQAPRVFFSPDYSAGTHPNRLPDDRHTLYWDADIKTGGQAEVTLPFYTSDLDGEFRIIVEGVTKEGQAVYAVSDFRVQP